MMEFSSSSEATGDSSDAALEAAIAAALAADPEFAALAADPEFAAKLDDLAATAEQVTKFVKDHKYVLITVAAVYCVIIPAAEAYFLWREWRMRDGTIRKLEILERMIEKKKNSSGVIDDVELDEPPKQQASHFAAAPPSPPPKVGWRRWFF